jgi:GR25 family glycosyltransferase involved in LPS biosynthesis
MVGIYASHYTALSRFAEESTKESHDGHPPNDMLLVLEDDVALSYTLFDELLTIVGSVPVGWHVVRFTTWFAPNENDRVPLPGAPPLYHARIGNRTAEVGAQSRYMGAHATLYQRSTAAEVVARLDAKGIGDPDFVLKAWESDGSPPGSLNSYAWQNRWSAAPTFSAGRSARL